MHTTADDGRGGNGTTAVGYVYAEWSHLTPAQKRAVKRFLTPSKTLRSTTKTTSATSGQQAILVAARTSARAVTPSFDYLTLAEDANLAEGTETGAPGVSGFVIGLDNIVTTTYAETRYYEVNENNGKWTPWPDGGYLLGGEFLSKLSEDEVRLLVS